MESETVYVVMLRQISTAGIDPFEVSLNFSSRPLGVYATKQKAKEIGSLYCQSNRGCTYTVTPFKLIGGDD